MDCQKPFPFSGMAFLLPFAWVSIDHDACVFGENVQRGLVPDHLLWKFDLDGNVAVFRAVVAELAVLVGTGGPDGAVFFQGQEMMVACGDFDDAGQGDLAIFRDAFEWAFCPVPAPDGAVFFEDQQVILAGGDSFDMVDAFHLDGMDHIVGQACAMYLAVGSPLPEQSVRGNGEGLAHRVGYTGDFASTQGVEIDFDGKMPFFRVRGAPVVAPAPEGVVFVNGNGMRDGRACHGDVVHDPGRCGRVGMDDVATPAAGGSPAP